MLIVDDDDLSRLALAELLQRSGVDVICASTPDEARRARECRVIVSELRLTGQTDAEGQALLDELRSVRPRSRVVIFSSFLDTSRDADAVAGAVLSIPKCTPLPEVAAAIRSLLQHHTATQGESCP